MDISGTQLRAVRAALFTALVVTLSAASHVLLSQVPLPLTTVALLSAGVFGVAFALAGRERGFGAIATVLIPLELAADTVFTTGQQVCYGPSGGPVTGALRSVGVDVLCGGGHDVGTPLASVAGPGRAAATALFDTPDPALPWLLLGAHVTVGLLAACWLRNGERALAALLRSVGAFAFRPLLVAVAVVTAGLGTVRCAALPTSRPRTSRDRLLVHSVGLRGPPCPALSLA
ncbi:hypothetical protein AB0436_01265 [Streptomyces sp. NPDC051322]|uniref:hypothetical protein n=1 Tax=Streptomyces sp. NPDC051322 TaxID=3154645 RepID=UPI00344C1FBE